MTHKTCGATSERVQVSIVWKRIQVDLIWVRALGVNNASDSWRLKVMKVRLKTKGSLWRFDSRMLEITSIGGIS